MSAVRLAVVGTLLEMSCEDNDSSVSPNEEGAFNRNMAIGRAAWGAMNRRRWVYAIGAGVSLATKELFGASQFWDKKEPSAWTSEEVLRLATKSPWAVVARVLPNPGRDRGNFDSTVPDLAGGNAGGRTDNNRLGEVPVIPVDEVTVVWESAQPLLDALKTTFPRDFANHYVIGVNELPTTEGRQKVNTESMTAHLQVRGKGAIDSGGILPGRNVSLFAFAKELLSLSAGDREALFMVETNQYSITARFDLKGMMYRGRLAV
jgi:hypothetical protein